MSQLALTENERRILERVEQQRGRANWHSVAVLLGPIDESPVTLLRELARRRLTREAAGDPAMTRYEITGLGRAALHGRAAVDDLLLLAEAIAAGPVLLVELFVDVLADRHAFAAALGRILDEHPAHRRAVALGLGYLPAGAPERVPVARRFFDEPALLLEALCPPRLHFLGEIDPPLPDPHWDELLARGLADSSPATRRHTAAPRRRGGLRTSPRRSPRRGAQRRRLRQVGPRSRSRSRLKRRVEVGYSGLSPQALHIMR
jgi:hypothetical protein